MFDYLVAAAYHSKGGSGLSRLFFCSSFLLCFTAFHLRPPAPGSCCLNVKKADEVCRDSARYLEKMFVVSSVRL